MLNICRQQKDLRNGSPAMDNSATQITLWHCRSINQAAAFTLIACCRPFYLYKAKRKTFSNNLFAGNLIMLRFLQLKLVGIRNFNWLNCVFYYFN